LTINTIWLERPHVRLKGYSATTKGTKSAVRIDLECLNPDALGYLLRNLAEIERSQQVERREEAAQAKAASKRKTLAIAAPALQIPYFPKGDL
jgi:hypothetical protein